ncbi:DUF5985 family protein [Noviherbaspirillum sp. CPCC 100848]|uniref:DUF5985 family protein n=1 Tax=Noviherbaspirillum album TaxID=3080276 RepID=A0ABU6JI26_9BURK|nr:DUF5985 family protein [Noviherbaspirillum sp. CPCC 100848]MEC4723163.1 DUF5985 family protein [Noviherbaspirillum sp. CPCC 100848]
MEDILTGAIATASFVVALYFFRFWKSTRDKLFLYFALAFVIEGGNRLVLSGLLQMSVGSLEEYSVYLLRLASYSLILMGIWVKNRGSRHKTR